MRKCDKFILHFPFGNFATKNDDFKLWNWVAIATEWNEFLVLTNNLGGEPLTNWWTTNETNSQHDWNIIPDLDSSLLTKDFHWIRGHFEVKWVISRSNESLWGQMGHCEAKWVISRSNESFRVKMSHFEVKWVISRSDESVRGQMSHPGSYKVEWILPVQTMIRQLRTPAQNPTIIA